MRKPSFAFLGVPGAVSLLTVVLVSPRADAATLQVGASRMYKQPADVRKLVQPGDIVEIDGDSTYTGGLIFDVPGTEAAKITVRGVRVNGKRPVISGGANAIEARASHYVFEALDITGGTSRCFYHHADDITLRDSIVHDCPKQGILGGDTDSGSMLLEYTEVHHCGGGTQDHQVYMSTDPEVYPKAVFRMQLCYIHDANGGNNVKSRASRNEIYYNHIEGALYHELECIGSDGHPEAAAREDADVVGNVFVKKTNFAVTRFGGDGTGQSNGRYRFVNNTVIVNGSAAVFRLFDGIESLEFHNNAFSQGGSGAVAIVREVEASWVGGKSTIGGSNNFIPTGATGVPATLTGTVGGSSPGFTNAATRDYRLTEGSPLVDSGANATKGVDGHEFPSPLAAPLFLPPPGVAQPLGSAQGRNTKDTIDIGAFELGGGGKPPEGVDGGTDPIDGGTPGDGEGGCSLTPGARATPLFGLTLAIALILVQRRRQHRPARTAPPAMDGAP